MVWIGVLCRHTTIYIPYTEHTFPKQSFPMFVYVTIERFNFGIYMKKKKKRASISKCLNFVLCFTGLFGANKKGGFNYLSFETKICTKCCFCRYELFPFLCLFRYLKCSVFQFLNACIQKGALYIRI